MFWNTFNIIIWGLNFKKTIKFLFIRIMVVGAMILSIIINIKILIIYKNNYNGSYNKYDNLTIIIITIRIILEIIH